MSDAALTISEEPPQQARATAAPLYDAFISYSHAKDKALAAALQSAMQRLGKPWYRRRALRLFRDDTSLTATPHLWPSIEKALGQSRFLILMASPEAAASRWVNQELAWWIGHKGADTVLIALTAGELEWDGATGDFHASEATPLPPALAGKFADEPLWIDLRPYRDDASPRDGRFTDLAASIAAALHGRAKEDLLSQEVRQQRRALRLAGSAVGLLVVLLGLAGWQWNVARAQRNRAERTLELATDTASALVFDLAQKFRNSGVPSSVIADILARARQLQDQLTSSGEISPELRRSQAAALTATVDTLRTAGDIKGALAAARQAHDIFQALLASAPDNTDYQRDLSIIDDKIGDVSMDQGDLPGALGAYRDSLAIMEPLAKKDPGNTQWQYDLGVNNEHIGTVLKAQGDLAGALAAYRERLLSDKALVAKDPSNAQWQRDLSIGDEKVGDMLWAQGDLAGALAAYRDELAIDKALTAKDPGNTQWQRDLAIGDNKIGNVLIDQGDLAGALAAYRDSLAIRRALAAKDPGNTEWQRDLAVSDGKIGEVLRAQGDLPGALASYRDGLAIVKALAAKDPGNAIWQDHLSAIDEKIGDLLQAQSDLPGALVAYRDSLAIRKALAEKDPSNAEWQLDLSIIGEKFGDVLQAQADLAGALAAFRDSLTIARTQAKLAPTNAEWQQELSLLLPRIAQVELTAGDAPGAVTADEEWVETARRIYAATPSGEAKAGLALALGDLSWALMLNNDAQNALNRADESLSLDPSLLFVQGNRAEALLLLGRFDEAKAIYLANKDKKIGEKPLPEVLRDDFAQLRKSGIDTPDMKRFEELLSG
jgi:tetratricopeptide (TPR) repeat protein